jgi:thiamine biosynthesis lipoprotein
VSVATATWEALGTSAVVAVTDAAALAAARRVVERELAAIDLACSRFRDDSELAGVHAAGGASVRIGPLLADAVAAALEAARRTDGLVDPTIGAALIAAGYDRDFAALPADADPRPAAPVPGWRSVRLDRERATLRLAEGTCLDLGATAKALAADRAALAAADEVAPHGVLVSLGGDLAVAGPAPAGGWPVGIADGHGDADVAATVAVRSGGFATSSTTQRRWRRGGADVHHILDPRTGLPAPVVWRTVSVAARSCLEANTASTAAIVLGAGAPAWLTRAGLPARLVHRDGSVAGTCGWVAGAAAA